MGRYESAAEYCEEIYALPPKIANFQIFDGDIEFYIDWEAVARDAQVNHITVHEVVGSEVHIYSK
jgi:antirestriction protein